MIFGTALSVCVLASHIHQARAAPAPLPTAARANAISKRQLGPGDSPSDPFVKPFDCSERDITGLQELFDADCFAHLCQGQTVLLQRWDGQDINRSIQEGNGASRGTSLFDNPQTWGTMKPPDSGAVVFNSPEEWPPASARQGGTNAVLTPVNSEAQTRQGQLLSSFYLSDPRINAQDHTQPPTTSFRGTWFRIGEWSKAQGPYCNALNNLLVNFAGNFNEQGQVQSDKEPTICSAPNIDLMGLMYDVGQYQYQIDTNNRYGPYIPVGKQVVVAYEGCAGAGPVASLDPEHGVPAGCSPVLNNVTRARGSDDATFVGTPQRRS